MCHIYVFIRSKIFKSSYIFLADDSKPAPDFQNIALDVIDSSSDGQSSSQAGVVSSSTASDYQTINQNTREDSAYLSINWNI